MDCRKDGVTMALTTVYKVVDEYENEFKTCGFSTTYKGAKKIAQGRTEEMQGHTDIVIYKKAKCGRFFPCREENEK